MCEIWNKCFLSLAEEYKKDLFGRSTEEYFQALKDLPILRQVWLQIYGVMVNLKILDRIENIEQEHKTTLWNDAKVYLPTGTKEEKLKLCKVIHAISVYIQQ